MVNETLPFKTNHISQLSSAPSHSTYTLTVSLKLSLATNAAEHLIVTKWGGKNLFDLLPMFVQRTNKLRPSGSVNYISFYGT